ncbi:NAD-binding D-isomer specific 2-hydroxyacid dehydrogenase protein [Neobacillus bataviensis LMG 21833]|uniref:NAD-binding D-isomer specific 2-hydroxyacid dehydrogenase protein n=1 Tax=Neobacillus bataviensis LMG 21833 TaxID=1117379 RepID=K6DZ28_9BACI|nr:D-2-hydroxyacid dehydrogenase [Neobacillus bataviensis]EKN66136.1 NAD-binding D-isomer specific 2-hydroxyacid dehydrogenase protein [Neobacillus bataviensis LMG 21833]
MKKRKIVITQNLEHGHIEQIKNVIPDWELIVSKDKEIYLKHAKDAEIIAGWKKGLEEFCLGQESKLKWLQTWSAGVDSLPLETIQSRNITLTSANGVHAYPISETIFALMLGLTRKIHTYVKNQQAKTWHHAHMGLELHEKTIGIIGVGEIGKETAKIAKAFGMNILGVRHSGKPVDNVDEMYTPDQLELLLPKCDYVVVTLPHTKETHHLFGTEQFKQMKTSAFFINIGRGEIVVEKELVEALLEGTIAGAGLDVFEKEPLYTESPFWEMENVIITPHTSGSTEFYNKRVVENIFIPNLKDYISGKTPSINLVDFSKGY